MSFFWNKKSRQLLAGVMTLVVVVGAIMALTMPKDDSSKPTEVATVEDSDEQKAPDEGQEDASAEFDRDDEGAGATKVDPELKIADGETKRVLISTAEELGNNAHVKIIRVYDNLPLVLAEIDNEGLDLLTSISGVEAISDNKVMELFDSLPKGGEAEVVEGSSANGPDPLSTIGGTLDGAPMPYFGDGTNKYAGAAGDGGYEVVVIDTGVDSSHLALTGKVVAEACFNSSTNGAYVSGLKVESMCPYGDLASAVTGAGSDCTINGCGHGTNVAGAVAMGWTSLSNSVITSGVAPASKIIAMKIASKQSYITLNSANNPCGVGVASCTLLYLSDVYAALDYTITLTKTRDKIVAVNMSLGTGAYRTNTTCRNAFSTTYDTFKTAVDQLKARGVATVVATGNNGDGKNQGNVGFPACVEGVISVGATSIDGSHLAYYSQNGSLTTLLAPGGDYHDGSTFGYMWLPLNGNPNSYTGTQGTSFASPTVAGAYAVLRSKYPNISVDEMTALLIDTSTQVTDTRSGYNNLKKPLINISAALYQNVDTVSSGMYNINGENIQIGNQTTIREVVNGLDTPFGLVFKNPNHETVYQSGATPYATAASLSSAGDTVDDGWTVETLSFPIDTFSPETYTLETQDLPDDGVVHISTEVEEIITVDVDKYELSINLLPASTSGNDRVQVTVNTNSLDGYTLNVSSPQPSLVCQSDSASMIAPLGSVGNLVNDRWGIGLGTISSAPTSWRGIGVTPYVIDSRDSVTATPQVSYIYAGLQVSYATKPCDAYQTQITITASVKD
ncbi:MAG: S8/S53 family peptidase [Candidatus Nomurabacteria bacterium]|jgi:hypothetical protein|nr:S8/S53 family peptidase [Candidatus Nomurabacteria bacterium]